MGNPNLIAFSNSYHVLRGADLVIRATGTVFETIEEGAYVNLVVKYGLIRLVNTKADLCEQVGNVDLECPIKKGVLSITKSVQIPKEVPPVSPSPLLLPRDTDVGTIRSARD